MHPFADMYVYMYVQTYVYVYTHMYIRIGIHIYIYTHVFMHSYTHIYIYMCESTQPSGMCTSPQELSAVKGPSAESPVGRCQL